MERETLATIEPRPSGIRSSFLGSAISTIGTRAIDLPCRYGFHLLVAWKLGLVDAGAFYIVFSFLTLAAGAGRLGIDRALTREVASSLAWGNRSQTRALIGHGLLLIAALSVTSALITAIGAPMLATRLLGNGHLTRPLVYAAIAIVPLCLSAGVAGALAGLHRTSLSQMVYSWLWPGLFCIIAIVVPLSLERAMVLLVIATTASLLCALVLLWICLPAPEPRSFDRTRSRSVMTLVPLGWSLFTTEIVQLTTSALPALVLGAVASQAAVGAYALAWRLSLILNLLIVAIAAMACPRFVDHAVHEDQAGLQRTAAQSLALVLGLGMIPLVALFAIAPAFLSVFGEGFASGTSTLRLLLFSQLILMLTATTPELLGMTGHERALRNANLWSIAIFVPALYVLARLIGADGAALATILVALFNACAATILSRKWLGFTPLGALFTGLRRIRRTAVRPLDS